METIDQLDWLRAEGCNEVQGFLFSAAKPASEIEQLLFRFGAGVEGGVSKAICVVPAKAGTHNHRPQLLSRSSDTAG